MKPIRRKDRAIDSAAAEAVLRSSGYGVMSTVDPSGQPYGIPLSYVWHDGNIYFHCAKIGHKLDNIEHNNRVAFTVVGRTRLLPEQFSTEYESVVAFGLASEVSGAERERALLKMLEKYTPEHIESGKAYIRQKDNATRVIKIEVEGFSGKARS